MLWEEKETCCPLPACFLNIESKIFHQSQNCSNAHPSSLCFGDVHHLLLCHCRLPQGAARTWVHSLAQHRIASSCGKAQPSVLRGGEGSVAELPPMLPTELRVGAMRCGGGTPQELQIDPPHPRGAPRMT